MEQFEKYTLESYLITGQDYADFQVAVSRMEIGKRKALLFRLVGMAMILFSLLGRLYFVYRNSYNSMVFFILTCLGVGICLYYDYGIPYIVRRRAKRYFNTKFKKLV